MASEPLHTEQQLVQLLQGGDKQAFEALFKRYFHHIYQSILRYTARHTEAEDIVQQVFVTLWEKRDSLGAIERIDKWLFTVALNEFRMRFRKARTSDEYAQYLRETFEQETDSPEEQLIVRQRHLLLRKAIENLSPKQREAWQLSRETGLTYAQIARQMNLEPTTVKEHISRAMKAIKAFITAHREEFLFLILISRNFFK